MPTRWSFVLFWAYAAISALTFLYLMFLDGFIYTTWNWLWRIPLIVIYAVVWPLYWLVLRWVT